MRKIGPDGQLERMICNACGKKLAVRQGIVLEGAISIDHTWDYFSEKDGQVDHFDLCEECYDQLTATFKIPGRNRRTDRVFIAILQGQAQFSSALDY